MSNHTLPNDEEIKRRSDCHSTMPEAAALIPLLHTHMSVSHVMLQLLKQYPFDFSHSSAFE